LASALFKKTTDLSDFSEDWRVLTLFQSGKKQWVDFGFIFLISWFSVVCLFAANVGGWCGIVNELLKAGFATSSTKVQSTTSKGQRQKETNALMLAV